MEDSNEASTALTKGLEYAQYRARHNAKKLAMSKLHEAPSAADFDALSCLYIAAGRHKTRALQLMHCAHDDRVPLPHDDASTVASVSPSRSNKSVHRKKEVQRSAAYRFLAAHRDQAFNASGIRTITPGASPTLSGGTHNSTGILVPGDMQTQDPGPTRPATMPDEIIEWYEAPAPQSKELIERSQLHPIQRRQLDRREAAKRTALAAQWRQISYGLSDKPVKGPLLAHKPPPPKRLAPLDLSSTRKSSPPRKASPPPATSDPSLRTEQMASHHSALLPSRGDVSIAVELARQKFNSGQLRCPNAEEAKAFLQGGVVSSIKRPRGNMDLKHTVAANLCTSLALCISAQHITSTNVHALCALHDCVKSLQGVGSTVPTVLAFGRYSKDSSAPFVARQPPSRERPSTPLTLLSTLLTPLSAIATIAAARDSPQQQADDQLGSIKWLLAAHGSSLIVAIASASTCAPDIGESSLPPAATPKEAMYPLWPGERKDAGPSAELVDFTVMAFMNSEELRMLEGHGRFVVEVDEARARTDLAYSFKAGLIRAMPKVDRWQKKQIVALISDEAEARSKLLREAAVDLVISGNLFDYFRGPQLRAARIASLFLLEVGNEEILRTRLTKYSWASWTSYVMERRAARLLHKNSSLLATAHLSKWTDEAAREAVFLRAKTLEQEAKASVQGSQTTTASSPPAAHIPRWAQHRANLIMKDIHRAIAAVGAPPDVELVFSGYDDSGVIAAALALTMASKGMFDVFGGPPLSLHCLGSVPVCHPDNGSFDAVASRFGICCTTAFLPQDPVLSLWEDHSGVVGIVGEAGAGVDFATSSQLPKPALPTWSRTGWTHFHNPHALLDGLVRCVNPRFETLTAPLTQSDEELLRFEQVAWNVVTSSFSNSVNEAIACVFKQLCNTLQTTTMLAHKDTLDPQALARLIHHVLPASDSYDVSRRATSFAVTSALQPLALRRQLLNAPNTPAVKRVTMEGFSAWLAEEFLRHRTSTVFHLFSYFGFHMWNYNLAYDSQACGDLTFLRVPPASDAKVKSSPITGMTLLRPSDNKFTATATAALSNVFEHFARSWPSSPYVGSGNGALCAAPDCMMMFLEQGGWSTRHVLSARVVVMSLWPIIEAAHVAVQPFGRSADLTTAASLLMTFEGHLTLRGFFMFVELLCDHVGTDDVCAMLYTLGYNAKLQHAINRGNLDNVHRPQGVYCPCAQREQGYIRLLECEEHHYRQAVEDELHHQQQEKLSMMSARSQKSLHALRSLRSVRRLRSLDSSTELPSGTASVKDRSDDAIGPFIAPAALLPAVEPRPIAATPTLRPRLDLNLSAAVRGSGPLASGPLRVPKSITPSLDATHRAEQRRIRRKANKVNKDVEPFGIHAHLNDSAGLYNANGAIPTLNPLQRKILRR